MRDFITKIEGHGQLKINWEEESVRLEISEGERLFEGLLINRSAEEMYWITSRICGVCPIAHTLASLNALENALGIIPNETTLILRNLMKAAQIIQSHVLHLFFLALPDYIDIDRGTELENKNPKAFQAALKLKEISDEIAFIIAGRSIHPTTPTIGGFHKIPTKKQLEILLNKIKQSEKETKITFDIFNKIKYPNIKVDLEFIAQKDKKIISSKSEESSVEDYKQNIQEEIKNYSTAKFGKYKNRAVMVGALARLKTQPETLMPQAAKALKKSKIDFQNPYHNNLAQAIEIMHCHELAKIHIEKLLKMEMDPTVAQPSKNPPLKGIGITEAPRGSLYHEVKLDKNLIIQDANIITPTVQNLTSIETSALAVLKQTKNLKQKERERLLTMLVRAYDPCITCATH